MTDKRIAIGELWRAVNHSIHDRFRHAFKEPSLPLGTLMLFRQIGREPGTTVSEIARACGIAKSHISKQVDLLASRDLVEKRPDPQDQRLQRLYLTEAARQAAADMEASVHRAWLQVVEEISEDDLDQVYRGFQILKEALERAKVKTESL